MKLGKLLLGAASLTLGYATLRQLNLSPPDSVTPVRQFDLSRYLGKWYEVGRLENRFERGLIQTTAEYPLNSGGTVRVVNRGYDPVRQRPKQAVGTAKFIGDQDVGALKVSFFLAALCYRSPLGQWLSSLQWPPASIRKTFCGFLKSSRCVKPPASRFAQYRAAR